jgi:hypothetical protein
MEKSASRTDTGEGKSQQSAPTQSLDVLRGGTAESSTEQRSLLSRMRQGLSGDSRLRNELYQSTTGDNPATRPPKDARLRSLVEQRGEVSTKFNEAIEQEDIAAGDKQMLQREQLYITRDSVTLEKVAGRASFARRYQSEKYLSSNIEAQQELER